MSDDIEIFSGAYLPSICLLWQSMVENSHFLIGLFIVLFQALDKDLCFANILSKSTASLFVLLTVSLKEQQAFILKQFHLLIFLLLIMFSVLYLRNLCLNQSFKDLSHIFSPGSFIVLSFAIRFVIHKMVTLTMNKINTILYFILHVTSEITE